MRQERINYLKNLILIYFEWKGIYDKTIQEFSKGKSTILSGVEFQADIFLHKEEFETTGQEILDGRYVREEDVQALGSLLERTANTTDSAAFDTAVRLFVTSCEEYKTKLKSKRGVYDLYNWIYSDHYGLTARVYFEGTEKDKLSIGQKGTILLKLFLAQGNSPLVADMPEENLDNKFIYKELVGAIKQAKNARQLIIATNNANLVVNTDAEQIIIADHNNNTISYESGSIENLAIRESIKNILEGGEKALKQREKKYGM